MAIEKQDESYCQNVRSRYDPGYDDALFSEYTRESCIIQLSQLKDDIEICKLTGEKDNEILRYMDINFCIRMFALNKEDKEIYIEEGYFEVLEAKSNEISNMGSFGDLWERETSEISENMVSSI